MVKKIFGKSLATATIIPELDLMWIPFIYKIVRDPKRGWIAVKRTPERLKGE